MKNLRDKIGKVEATLYPPACRPAITYVFPAGSTQEEREAAQREAIRVWESEHGCEVDTENVLFIAVEIHGPRQSAEEESAP